MASLGVEMAASRLLAPFFGTSLLVWANLIGLILVYLALGYWLGGRLADRTPDPGLLYSLTATAGFLVGLVPFVARPILLASVQSFFDASVSLFLGSLLASLALFSLPVILLGMLSPFAVRLSVQDVQSAGHSVGSLYALSTLGSILGVFLPVLVLIPLVGTRRTFLLLAVAVLGVSLAGLLVHARRRASLGAAAGLVTLLLLEVIVPTSVRPQTGLLFEGESPYHFVQVFETSDGDRYLVLNEGQALHSWYNPDRLVSGGIWDAFALAPLFAAQDGGRRTEDGGKTEDVISTVHRPSSSVSSESSVFRPPSSVLIIGLAGGTVARQYTAIYGPLDIVGVEIDPLLVEVGQRYFGMQLSNLRPVLADGRTWLQTDRGRYDVIIVDAYRQPYIPFHLTTVEFFGQTRDHLTDNGVLAINVGHSPTDLRLLDTLAATLRAVFPSVYAISPEGSYNSLLVATRQPSSLDDFQAHARQVDQPTLRQVLDTLANRVSVWQGEGQVLTDDEAPVELLTDQIILRYALTGH